MDDPKDSGTGAGDQGGIVEGSGESRPVRGPGERFFSLKGRRNRSDFWIIFFFLTALSVAVNIGMAYLANAWNNAAVLILWIPLFIPVCWAGLANYVQRFHDLDQSGWYSAFMVIPIVNFVFFLILGFKRGTPGPNRFG